MNFEINKIYNEDCIKYMKTLPNECVDLIIADPPYFNIKGDFDFIWTDVNEYISWCKKWCTECYRILKNNGSFYIQQQSIRQLVIYSKQSSQGLYPDVSATILDTGNGTKKIPTITSYPSFVFIIGV